MKKINITIVASNLSGKGGTESVISYILTNKLIGKKIEFGLFLPFGKQDFLWIKNSKNLKKIRWLPLQKKDGSVLARFVRLVWSAFFYMVYSGQVLLISNSRQIKIASIIKRIFKKNYVVVSWMHFSLLGVENINENFVTLAEKHLAISNGIFEQLINLGIPAEDIYVIYNPVASTNERICRSKAGDIKELLYVGRIQLLEQKNLQFMLNGLSHLTFRWHLTIVGDGDDLEKLKEKANQLKILSNMSFYGWMSEPWNSLTNIDAFILTSTTEGFGMSLVEAIARGIPVVSSNCPVGPQDIVRNGINGELYENGNISDFVKKLEKVVYGDYIDTEKISNSIDDLYDSNYERRFIGAINKILKI